MATYYHGVRVLEESTALVTPLKGTAGLQVIFGTAPIHLAKEPYKAANQLFLCNSFSECVEQLGYSDDFEAYSLCESMDVNFRVFNVAPIILCNVLDPKVHIKKNEAKEYSVANGKIRIDKKGILLDTLEVKAGETKLEQDTDYVASFDEAGFVLIALLEGGAGASAGVVIVSSTSIDPSAVKASDIIGGYDVNTGVEKGMELIRAVYPKFGMTPGLIVAPKWSKDANVAAVMAAKSEAINGVFRCENVIDLDTKQAKKYTDCKEVKENNGLTGKHSILLYPMLKLGEKQYHYSAVYGALVAYTDASNDDVPNLSPSNKLLGVSGTVLEDGTEVNLDQFQAATLNSQGIVTAINQNGWRTWGNNMACYPSNTDPKDRWIPCRRFFSWWGNSFILTYNAKVDDPANHRLIESICDAENIKGNSYAAQGKCAGVKIEYLEEENPITDILNGKIQFRQYLAPYTPAEDILNVLEFSPDMIKTALGGE